METGEREQAAQRIERRLARLGYRVTQPRRRLIEKMLAFETYFSSDVLAVGEPIPADALARCERETRLADCWLLVGTSAVVYPAAAFPQMAARRGIPLIEVDPEQTALSDVVEYALRGPAGEVLPRLADEVLSRRVK